jgi:hypothetical protein
MTISQNVAKSGFYERLHCASGFSISIQAGKGKYSTPRAPSELYEAVELGYPSMPISEILPWAEGIVEDPTSTVYMYVPAQVVLDLIKSHGGPVSGGCPPLASPVLPPRKG